MSEHRKVLNSATTLYHEPSQLNCINKHYYYEEKLMEAIIHPNIENCKEAMVGIENTYYRDIFEPRCPDDPVLEYKQSTLRLNTILRIAAKQGGLPPVYLHVLSDRFASHTLKLKKIDELKEYRLFMAMEYVSAVSEYTIKDYSSDIGEIITYINYHLLEDLSLTSVAERFNFSIAYLSRKFRKETGLTFTEFIAEKRIALAKLYLQTGYKNITKLSHVLRFHDCSYFIKVFKKSVGVTPTQYIKTWNKAAEN